MKSNNCREFPVFSSSYLLYGGGAIHPIERVGSLVRLIKYLFAIPGRSWRLLRLEIILIVVLSIFCGVCVGYVVGFGHGDSYVEEITDAVELLLHEASILAWKKAEIN
jgi:hypothetical protein